MGTSWSVGVWDQSCCYVVMAAGCQFGAHVWFTTCCYAEISQVPCKIYQWVFINVLDTVGFVVTETIASTAVTSVWESLKVKDIDLAWPRFSVGSWRWPHSNIIQFLVLNTVMRRQSPLLQWERKKKKMQKNILSVSVSSTDNSWGWVSCYIILHYVICDCWTSRETNDEERSWVTAHARQVFRSLSTFCSCAFSTMKPEPSSGHRDLHWKTYFRVQSMTSTRMLYGMQKKKKKGEKPLFKKKHQQCIG